MATIHKEILIDAAPEQVWDAVRDIGQIHKRLVPGFVTDCALEPGARLVTFGNGMVAREVIVDLDESQRRLVWSAKTAQLQHHNASMQIFDEGHGRSRAVWIADLLPHELKDSIATMIDHALATMKKTLEQVTVKP